MNKIAQVNTWSISLDRLKEKFELSRGGKSDNLRAMEGLRGFAVFLVFLVHYVTLSKPWISNESALSAFAHHIHTIGNAGVDLFFILSGYLIYGSVISKPQKFMRFMRRRIRRIYPAFIFVFIAYLILSVIFPGESKIPIQYPDKIIYLIENLLLLPGLFPIEPIITVAWSLSYEIFYYISIPLIVSLFQLRQHNIGQRVIFFLMVTSIICAYCALFGGPIRLIMFIAGILLYEAMADRKIVVRSVIALPALIIGLLFMLFPINGSGALVVKILVLFISFFLVCLCCFGRPNGYLAKAFSWRPIRWLGNMSYSYYLIHGLSLKAAFLVVTLLFAKYNGALMFWGFMPVMFVLTLVTASCLFLFVERPFSLLVQRNKDSIGSIESASHAKV